MTMHIKYCFKQVYNSKPSVISQKRDKLCPKSFFGFAKKLCLLVYEYCVFRQPTCFPYYISHSKQLGIIACKISPTPYKLRTNVAVSS